MWMKSYRIKPWNNILLISAVFQKDALMNNIEYEFGAGREGGKWKNWESVVLGESTNNAGLDHSNCGLNLSLSHHALFSVLFLFHLFFFLLQVLLQDLYFSPSMSICC